MAFRTHRFTDTEKNYVKFPNPADAFGPSLSAVNLDLSEVLDLLEYERQHDALYDKAWREAEKVFQERKSALVNTGLTPIPRESHVAIVAYTLDLAVGGKKLYDQFNKECRKLRLNDDDITWYDFPYKSMYCLLMRAIHGVKNNPALSNKAYRGVNFHYDKKSLDEDGVISFNQFTSCSADPGVAKMFQGSKASTVIEFPGHPLAAIGIDNYSPFDEKEILVYPWSTFKVKKFDRSTKNHRIVLETVGPYVEDLPYSGKYASQGISFD